MRRKFPIILLILIYGSTLVNTLNFADPDQDGVTFGQVNADTQEIFLDENNHEGVVIALIVEAVSKPSLNALNPGVPIDAAVQEESGNYFVVIQNSIDYENPNSRNCLFEIFDGTSSKTIKLTINNLDDNNPVLKTASSCEMEENNQNATCKFELEDADGWLNLIHFENVIINSDKQEDTLFEMGFSSIPKETDTTSDVYLSLKNGTTLDYENITLYSFNVAIKDNGDHPTTPEQVQIIVVVKDVPDQPPVFTTLPYTLKILEDTSTTITVSARDGDYGINWDINYRIDEEYSFVTIADPTKGEIFIDKIDRDAGYDQYQFAIVAYEIGETDNLPPEIWQTTENITLLIEDIDDNIPIISVNDKHEMNINVSERATSIDELISISDIDLGDNAMYTVSLTEIADQNNYTNSFQVVPVRGYENTTFSLVIKNSEDLDFEKEGWQVIQFQICSQGVKNESMSDSLDVTINLIDWNDEVPVFEHEGVFEIEIPENYAENEPIISIIATDRDAGDVVTHTIVGITNQAILTIPEQGGDVKAIKPNAFDYEKQQQVVVQIRAIDTANHLVTAQLTINIADVNDENPTIKVSTDKISIEENSPDGTLIESDISASDEDGDAILEFTINWDKSYATKNSQPVSEFQEYCDKCINVDTIPISDSTRNVQAKLTIVETKKDNTPDYEIYDTIILSLVVNDTKTVEGDGTYETTVTITIVNKNDCPPQFTEDTKNAIRSVSEAAPVDTLIGIITATDEDDPKQIFEFSLKPGNDATPDNWVRIDNTTGQLFVAFDDIDCDEPQRDALEYIITASDGENLSEPLTIKIDIIDINDNAPTFSDTCSVKILEDNGLHEDETQDGDVIYKMVVHDNDRSEPNNIVSCRVVNADETISDRFTVIDNNITIQLQNGATLDREKFENGFSFTVQCSDMPQNSANTKSISVPCNVLLEDVNDNYPEITTTDVTSNENIKKDKPAATLAAEDKDLGENGMIVFSVSNIEWFEDEYQTPSDKDVPEGMFTIDGSNFNSPIVVTNVDLKGFYGYFRLTINASDKGKETLSKESIVHMEVKKFNFEGPTILFPDQTSYLLNTIQTAGKGLQLYNTDPFPNFRATDTKSNNDSLKFDITFDYNTESDDIFKLVNQGNSQAQLQIAKSTNNLPTGVDYQLNITATINEKNFPGEEAAYSKSTSITIQFFNMDSDPIFDQNEMDIDFNEQKSGLTKPTATAHYPFDLPNVDIKVFYLLEPKSSCPDSFQVDKLTGDLTVVTMLDYDVTKNCLLTIQASNSETLKENPSNSSRLFVTVTVNDVNNHPPEFVKSPYFGTILTNGDKLGNTVIETTVTDIDTVGTLTYAINDSTLFASDPSIKNIKEPFKIDNNGKIILNFNFQANMKGYFSFDIKVEDGVHETTTQVTIYIVTDTSTVNFKFENSLDVVISKQSEIKDILDGEFSYKSNIENPTVDSGSKDITIAPVYFIDESKHNPVENSIIIKSVTNLTVFTSLRRQFANQTLTLLSFVTQTPDENLEEVLKAWLIGISVVLGALVLILLIAFILKTRALNQRIKNLLRPKFGSQDSGLNRQGVAVPTSNKHAVEGSNPVFNNEIDTKEIDRISNTSGDSDLIGVEDNPEFDYDINENDDIEKTEL